MLCCAVLRGAEAAGDALSLLTWVAFGSAVAGLLLRNATPAVIVYAVLSLTVIRMLPVGLCLLGTGVGLPQSLFIGWFGPRGLASIVSGSWSLTPTFPATAC
jgi:sodium/hydrogen antiporter